MYLFVSALPSVCLDSVVGMLKCISVQLLFNEFTQINLRFWVGNLCSEGYVVRTACGCVYLENLRYLNSA